MWRICVSNRNSLELGLLVIRVGIGIVFAVYGCMKLMAGPAKWLWLGSQLAYVGITVVPTVWGFLAANAEFFGGICLIFGFATRLATLFIICVMVVALLYHMHHGDSWDVYAHALSLCIVLIGLCLAGPGTYSFDEYLYNKQMTTKVE